MNTVSPSSVLRSTSIVGGLTLVSRILGFLWNLAIARVFGASALTDTFFVAYRIPNLLRSFLAEGALTSAFVPVLASRSKESKQASQHTINSVFSLLIISTLVISLLGIIFAREIVTLIAPGFTTVPEKLELCVQLTRIMLPYIIFVSLITLINSTLNNVGVFGASALAQIAMNITLIIGTLVASLFLRSEAIYILATAVMCGGIVQILAQIPALRKSGYSLRFTKKIFTKDTKQILFLMFPAILGAAVYQIAIFLNTVLASLLREGSISWLFYSDRVSQFPIGIFTIALASVLLPTLSKIADSDPALFAKTLLNSLRYTSFVMIPTAFAIFFYSEDVLRIIFERKNFTANDTKFTALAIQATCFGLWTTSCSTMTMRAFIAKKDTITPSLIGATSLLCGIFLALMLMGEPEHKAEGLFFNTIVNLQIFLTSYIFSADLGHVGLALSSSLISSLSLFIALLMLNYKGLNFSLKPFLLASIQALLASVGMLSIFCIFDFLLTNKLLAMLLGCFLGGIIYLVITISIGSTEAKESLELVKKKLS